MDCRAVATIVAAALEVVQKSPVTELSLEVQEEPIPVRECLTKDIMVDSLGKTFMEDLEELPEVTEVDPPRAMVAATLELRAFQDRMCTGSVKVPLVACSTATEEVAMAFPNMVAATVLQRVATGEQFIRFCPELQVYRVISELTRH